MKIIQKLIVLIGILLINSCAKTAQVKEPTETESLAWPMVAFFPGCGGNTRCALPQDISASGDTKKDILRYLETVGASCKSGGPDLPDYVECFLRGEETVKFSFTQGKVSKAEFLLCHDIPFPSHELEHCFADGIEKLNRLFSEKVAQRQFQMIFVNFAKSPKSEEKIISSENLSLQYTSLIESLPVGQEFIVKPLDQAVRQKLLGRLTTLKHEGKESPVVNVTLSFLVPSS